MSDQGPLRIISIITGASSRRASSISASNAKARGAFLVEGCNWCTWRWMPSVFHWSVLLPEQFSGPEAPRCWSGRARRGLNWSPSRRR